MKCRVCNSDVLELFLFCHSCGSSLKDPHASGGFNPASSSSSMQMSAGASAAVVGPCFPAIPRLPVRPLQLPRFEDFRKRVSAERTGGLKRKKPSQPKEVMINVGIMKNRDGTLCAIKGKTMSLRVPTTIRKVQLLTMGMDKHGDHDQSFNRFGDYTIVYPDGREILTIPGKPAELFQLDKYKEEVGKPYNRITLFLVKREELEIASEEEFSSSDQADMETSTKSSFQSSNDDLEVLIGSKDNERPSIKAISAALPEQSPLHAVVAGAFSSQVSDASENSQDVKTLRDIFPHLQENEITMAANATDSLEDAINVLLNTKTSLNDAYASLIDEASNDIFASEHQYSERDGSFAEASSSFSIDEVLKMKLDVLKASELKPDDYWRLKVRRSSVWEDTMLKLSQIKPVDFQRALRVQFIGEPAVDQGGPSREFFSILNSAAKRKIISNGIFRHDISLLQQKQYFSFGQLTALGLLQGSPGPKCFQKSVVDYVLYRDIGMLSPTIDEIPDVEVSQILAALAKIEDANEFKKKASFECDFRFEAGYSKALITLEDKENFFKCISLHYTVLSTINELNQFIEGLKSFNIYSAVCESPEIFRKVFQTSSGLTAELVDSVFQPIFSPKGSNRYTVEEHIVFNFNQYLEDVERGAVKVVVSEEEVTIRLENILQFVTGSEEIPAIGFSPRPTIEFLHDLETPRKLSVSTCANVITLPVAGMTEYKHFFR